MSFKAHFVTNYVLGCVIVFNAALNTGNLNYQYADQLYDCVLFN